MTMMAEFNDENFEFYYITYSVDTAHRGCVILPQFKTKDGQNSPDGFDITGATSWLIERYNAIVIVDSWHKTTKRRRDDFEIFLRKINGLESGAPDGRASHLQLVPNPPTQPPPAV